MIDKGMVWHDQCLELLSQLWIFELIFEIGMESNKPSQLDFGCLAAMTVPNEVAMIPSFRSRQTVGELATQEGSGLCGANHNAARSSPLAAVCRCFSKLLA